MKKTIVKTGELVISLNGEELKTFIRKTEIKPGKQSGVKPRKKGILVTLSEPIKIGLPIMVKREGEHPSGDPKSCNHRKTTEVVGITILVETTTSFYELSVK